MQSLSCQAVGIDDVNGPACNLVYCISLLWLCRVVVEMLLNWITWMYQPHVVMHSECFFVELINVSITFFTIWLVYMNFEVALQRAEKRMVRWVCGVKVKTDFQVMSWERRTDDIILVLQQNRLRKLWWYQSINQSIKVFYSGLSNLNHCEVH